jgi:hypothetical protein
MNLVIFISFCQEVEKDDSACQLFFFFLLACLLAYGAKVTVTCQPDKAEPAMTRISRL